MRYYVTLIASLKWRLKESFRLFQVIIGTDELTALQTLFDKGHGYIDVVTSTGNTAIFINLNYTHLNHLKCSLQPEGFLFILLKKKANNNNTLKEETQVKQYDAHTLPQCHYTY